MNKNKITECLHKLDRWFLANKPEFYSKFNLGLSSAEITALTANLQLKLPDEIVVLYMWRNGTPKNWSIEFFPHYRFLPLEEAIAYYYEMIDDTIDGGGQVIDGFDLSIHCEWSYSYFTIFYSIDPIIIKIDKEATATTPVVEIFAEDCSATLKYNTLSNFISFITECYETEVFQITENKFGGFVEVTDRSRYALIYAQFEPSLISEENQ
ncbi:SMI1/KNR4 family protein [Pseudanabaena sp. UWO310]|uniref:SMI1/KNR4 family protein n=1 Tax=Pseudanabaena sp. UWO310 TaxID=2480795 RepID=UPI001158C071|nr:SMI1/KNR4 family protein [Pseudanabaena sp. UWO310]TYQ31804.1 SMI1/KNR4 family protein [Pseudanabaena sp. UWO310]